jgi:pentatricopeptide repeat protein
MMHKPHHQMRCITTNQLPFTIPTPVVLSSTPSALMNVAVKAGQMQHALKAYRQLLEEGCTPNVVTYNTLIDIHSKTGQVNAVICHTSI